MLHAKFQDHKTSGSEREFFLKVFTIYGRGSHLGHVTGTKYMYIALGQGQTTPWYQICFIYTFIQSI